MSLAIVILSGGLDSVVLAHLLQSEGHDLHLLSFDYSQRHARELEYSRLAATRLNARHDVIDIRSVGRLLGGSALTDENIAVPHGHYAAPSMAITIVPNRNAIFLTIAYGVAVARNAQLVATAVHAGDHFIYPDCRAEFLESFAAMQRLAVEGCGDENLKLHAPFVHRSKTYIVQVGALLDVPFEETWSCYEGGEIHCGQCGTCVERKEAFERADVYDPTEYAS
jgi:7-cyano-7-deazaguanine synthase